jgi:glycosyltransferase involved in cell wall biosynthesis
MYASHDALVLPTLSDGFGLVVTEALAHGLPVITTDQCGAGELIEHGVNGLRVRAADTEDLMAALAFCAHNRDALHAMRAAALRGAAQRTWTQYRAALRAALHVERGA